MMKKLLGILVLGLMLVSSPSNSGSIGTGELTLSESSVEWFIKYLRGGHGNKPLKFLITTDGMWPDYWFCPVATCTPGGDNIEIKVCEQKTKRECKVFARSRTIKWKNGINKGNRESKFNSKWSDAEIRAKLTELGFLGAESESFVTKKTEKKKEEKKAETKETTQTQQVAKKMEGSSLKVFRYGVSGQKLYAIYINFIESEKCDYVGPFLSTKCTWFLKENILHFDLSNAIFNSISDSAEKYYYGSFSVDLTQDKLIVKNNLNQKIFAELNKKPTQTQIAKKELTIKPKEEVKQTDDGNNITQQLKDLNEMYKSGALTKEEFTKAKKKLLN